jgi:hypothetical protein
MRGISWAVGKWEAIQAGRNVRAPRANGGNLLRSIERPKRLLFSPYDGEGKDHDQPYSQCCHIPKRSIGEEMDWQDLGSIIP